MRSELLLILWVTAIVSMVALFSPDVDQTPMSETGAMHRQDVAPPVTVSSTGGPAAVLARIEGGRTIFASARQSSTASVAPEPVPAEVPMPELRGIVTVSGLRKAVFYDGTPEGRYVLVSVGEAIGGIHVDAIGVDRVAGRNQAGEAVEFLLRADGEDGEL